jgi:hypothetical protein
MRHIPVFGIVAECVAAKVTKASRISGTLQIFFDTCV